MYMFIKHPLYFPDFCYPWRGLANSKEQYALRYESKYLKEMGGAMDYLFKVAVTQATQEALKFTVLSSKLIFRFSIKYDIETVWLSNGFTI